MPQFSRRDTVKLGLATMVGSAPALPAFAQSKFPERPIRLIVPRAAGGPLDVIGRQWAEQVKSGLGTVVIENVGGGGGTIGTVAAARANPDGYTVALLGAGELVVNPVIRPNPAFVPSRDLIPISILTSLTCAIAVSGTSPVKTAAELTGLLKSNPGKMTYGSPGTGTMAHLAGELFKQLAGVSDVVHVPYKGSASAFVDLMAGNIHVMAFTLSGETISMHKTGKIRILAVGSDQRIAAVPDVPTGAEAGLPKFVAGNFLGLFAPASTPRPIVEQISQAAGQSVSDQAFRSKMLAQAYELSTETRPSDAARFVAGEIDRWTPVIKVAGLGKT